MLLANQQHQPYFMHSQPTTIMVTNNSGVDPKPLITPGLRLMLPEGLLRTRFRMQFHACGLNVDMKAKDNLELGRLELRIASTSGKGTNKLD